ncbi:MAG: NUDIX domain-containing protein [Candidatus Shapirobacteria bacterium]|jgi:ADP-ribose pyrophosphatase YjhB (NUDIX family)
MENHKINVRLRLIIIKNNKLLTQYTQKNNFYFYIGGHLDYGETIVDGCQREIEEECGEGTKFEFKKILYIRDFIMPEDDEHSVELFILGKINRFEELEKKLDPQHPDGSMWCEWLDMEKLPSNLLPSELTEKLIKDYKNNFSNSGEYVGRIK